MQKNKWWIRPVRSINSAPSPTTRQSAPVSSHHPWKLGAESFSSPLEVGDGEASSPLVVETLWQCWYDDNGDVDGAESFLCCCYIVMVLSLTQRQLLPVVIREFFAAWVVIRWRWIFFSLQYLLLSGEEKDGGDVRGGADFDDVKLMFDEILRWCCRWWKYLSVTALRSPHRKRFRIWLRVLFSRSWLFPLLLYFFNCCIVVVFVVWVPLAASPFHWELRHRKSCHYPAMVMVYGWCMTEHRPNNLYYFWWRLLISLFLAPRLGIRSSLLCHR